MTGNQKQQHISHQNQATAKTKKTEPKAVRNIDPVQMTSAPETLRSEDVLAAQQQFGNQVVQRALDQKGRDHSITDGQGNLNEDLASQIQAKRGGGSPLPEAIQQDASKKLGRKFNDVRIHTDDTADKLSRSVSARAFTIGSDIFFKGGVFTPGSSAGRETLIHELTHVVQQSGSKTSEAGKLKLGAPDTAMEKQAAQIGKKHATQPGTATFAAGAVQRQEEEEEMQMQPDANSLIQRQEEEEEMQMQPDANSLIQRQEEEEEMQMQPDANAVIQRAGDGLTEDEKEDLNPPKGKIHSKIADRVALFEGSNKGKKDPVVGSTPTTTTQTQDVGSTTAPTTTPTSAPTTNTTTDTTTAPTTDTTTAPTTDTTPAPTTAPTTDTTTAPTTDTTTAPTTDTTTAPTTDTTTSQVSDSNIPVAPDITGITDKKPWERKPRGTVSGPKTELQTIQERKVSGAAKKIGKLEKTQDKKFKKNVGKQLKAEKGEQKAAGRLRLMTTIRDPKSSAEDVAAAKEKLDMLHKRSLGDQIKSLFTKGESRKSYANQAKAQREKALKDAATTKGDDEAFKKYKSEKKPGIGSKISGLFKKGAGFLTSKLKGVAQDQAKSKFAESQKQFPQFFGSGDKEKEDSKPADGGGGGGGGGGGLAETISQLYQENKQLKDELAALKKAPAP